MLQAFREYQHFIGEQKAKIVRNFRAFTVILFLASGPVAYQQIPISEEFIPEITGQKEERIPSPIEAVKPMFIERLQNSLLVPDTNIIFECYVSGQPFPEIYWFKGDKPLKPDAR